jgi:HTH-type transcriptional regulator/antitoxin HipB
MRTLQELGAEVAARRRALGLKQIDIAARSGVTAESLSRFERGRTSEFGSRKLMAVLAEVGMELILIETPLTRDKCLERPRSSKRFTPSGLEG